MTSEEAIKIIDCYDIGFYDLSGEKIPADKLADAFDMAIEALTVAVSREDTVTLNSPISIQAEMVAVVRCKDCIRNNDGNFCDIAFFINDDGDGFCNCGERKRP